MLAGRIIQTRNSGVRSENPQNGIFMTCSTIETTLKRSFESVLIISPIHAVVAASTQAAFPGRLD